MKKLLSLFIVFNFICNAFAQNAKPSIINTANWKTYEDAKASYTIKYADNWEMRNNDSNSVVYFISPEENANDMFRENINLQSTSLDGEVFTIKQFVQASIPSIKKYIKGYKKISERYFKVGKYSAYETECSGYLPDVSHLLKWKQWYIIGNDRTYVWSYTAQADKKDAFYSTATAILKSFLIQ